MWRLFQTLKVMPKNAPVLTCPTNDGRYSLETDACNYGIGAVLSQVQNGQEREIAYAINHTVKTVNGFKDAQLTRNY